MDNALDEDSADAVRRDSKLMFSREFSFGPRIAERRGMAFFAPFVVATGALCGRPPRDHRRTLDAIFWITHTGTPWRDLRVKFRRPIERGAQPPSVWA